MLTYLDFEAEADVFADMELRTINDLAELQTILGADQTQHNRGAGQTQLNHGADQPGVGSSRQYNGVSGYYPASCGSPVIPSSQYQQSSQLYQAPSSGAISPSAGAMNPGSGAINPGYPGNPFVRWNYPSVQGVPSVQGYPPIPYSAHPSQYFTQNYTQKSSDIRPPGEPENRTRPAGEAESRNRPLGVGERTRSEGAQSQLRSKSSDRTVVKLANGEGLGESLFA